MMRASPSAKGLRQTRDVMNLNGTLAELTGNTGEYSEWCYWITIMGGPSATAPWGWQPDGRHAIINRFVPGDQAVMTPVFMGSEPVRAASGKFKGTVVLQAGQDKGLALMQALNASQQAAARIPQGQERQRPARRRLQAAGSIISSTGIEPSTGIAAKRRLSPII
jgi:hypothetical protein